MNKIVATLLCISFLFQFTVLAESATNEMKDEIITESEGYILSEADNEKLDFMQSIGILTDIGEEDISSNRNITRSDLAKAVVGLYGNRYANYSSTEVIYNDVKETADYYDAVNLLHELNIVSGYGDRTFKPENDIKLNEAVKIITSVMGYTMLAEERGGFPSGYMSVAAECDILKGVKIDNVSSSLKISQLIPMLYNALEAKPLIQIMFTSDGLEYKMTEDETLLSIYFDIYKGKGIVTGNEYTSLLGANKSRLDCVSIDNYEYLDKNSIADGYLGYKVQFYYRDTDDDYELVWIKTDSKCKVVEIFTDDIIEEKTTAYSIGYEEGNRSRILQLKEDVNVIYNGVEYSGFTSDLFNSVDGKFVAISWDNASEYDVLLVNDYEYYIVDRVNVEDNIIRDKFGRILECTIDDEPDNVIIEDVEGTPVTLENLLEWETLAVQKSMDNSYFKITVFRNYIQGEISSYRSNVGDASITIDDNEYLVSENYPDINNDDYPLDFVLNVDTFIVLDLNNKVILIDSERASMKYGIVTKIYRDENENILYAKIMNDKGIFNKYQFANKVKIDGKSFKTEKDETYGQVIQALQEGDLVTALESGESWTEPSDYVMQLVRYIINDEDQISEIDTSKENNGQNPSQLVKLYNVNTKTSRGVSMLFKSNDYTFNKVIATNANTKVFFVPSPVDAMNEDSYAVENSGYFKNDSSYSIIPYGTSFKDVMGAGAILMVGSFTKNVEMNRIAMFDKSIQTLNEYEEAVTEVSFYNGNKKETLYTNDLAVESIIGEMDRGDLFRYATSANGYISVVEKVFDAEDKQFVAGIETNINNTSASSRYVFADVYDRSDEIIKITNVFRNGAFSSIYGSQVLKDDLLELHSVELYNSTTGLAVYDENSNQIRTATIDNIRTYSEYSNKCSKVFVATSYGEAKHLYIYNYR